MYRSTNTCALLVIGERIAAVFESLSRNPGSFFKTKCEGAVGSRTIRQRRTYMLCSEKATNTITKHGFYHHQRKKKSLSSLLLPLGRTADLPASREHCRTILRSCQATTADPDLPRQTLPPGIHGHSGRTVAEKVCAKTRQREIERSYHRLRTKAPSGGRQR